MKHYQTQNEHRMLPISEYQKRFFLEWALAPNDSTYNVSLVFKITGDLDKRLFKQAYEVFIQQHEAFYARYIQNGSECYYENYQIDDFYHEVELDTNLEILSQIRAILDKPFNLT